MPQGGQTAQDRQMPQGGQAAQDRHKVQDVQATQGRNMTWDRQAAQDRLMPQGRNMTWDRQAAGIFIGCGAGFEECKIALFGAPFDGTSSYRPGSRFACAKVRGESYSIETYSPYIDMDLADDCGGAVFDAGDLELPFGSAARALQMIEEYVSALLENGKFPLMLGGEHLVTLGAVRAASRAYPGLAIIQFDAHADLRGEFLGEELSHATVMRRCHELTGDGRIFQFGVRSGERAEFAFAAKHTFMGRFGFGRLSEALTALAAPAAAPAAMAPTATTTAAAVAAPATVPTVAPAAAAPAEAVSAAAATTPAAMAPTATTTAPAAAAPATAPALSGGRPVYLTIDLDVLDPSELPGTGTPEAGGVSFTVLLAAARAVIQNCNVIGLDITELNPPLDPSGASVSLTCKLLRELLLLILANKR